MHPEIITLCHSAIVQADQLSILAAFNTIHVSELPHKFPPFTLACRLRFDRDLAGDHNLKVTVVDPDGRVLGQMIVSFRLAPESFGPTATMNLVFPITGMELRALGEHAIDLILDERPALRTPFYVTKG
jgi:hypothetical protein